MVCCLTLQIQVFRYRDLMKTQTIRFPCFLLHLYLLSFHFSFHSLIPPLIYLPFLLLISSFSTCLPLLLFSSASSSLSPRLHSPPSSSSTSSSTFPSFPVPSLPPHILLFYLRYIYSSFLLSVLTRTTVRISSVHGQYYVLLWPLEYEVRVRRVAADNSI